MFKLLKLAAALCSLLLLPAVPAHAAWHTMYSYSPFPLAATPVPGSYPAKYSCRVAFEGGIHSGWTSKGSGICSFGWGGLEHDSNVYDIWVEDWQPGSNGNVPANSIVLGYEQPALPYPELSIQKPRYACQVLDPTYGVATGKVAPDIGGCDYPWNGVELHATSYTVLVDSALSMIDSTGGEKLSVSAVTPQPVDYIYFSNYADFDGFPLVNGGYQSNGVSLTLCTAYYLDGIHIGSVPQTEFANCNISYGGKEISNLFPYSHFAQSWTGPTGTTLYTNGNYPVDQPLGYNFQSTIIGGNEADGSHLYVCAGSVPYPGLPINTSYPGKLSKSINGCSIALNGKEYIATNYSVFVETYAKPAVIR